MRQPCRIETGEGPAAEGELLAFDLGSGRLAWRRADGLRETLPFSRCRRLTLTAPLRPMDVGQSRRQNLLAAVRPTEHLDGAAGSVLPMAEHARSYALLPRGAGGRTLRGDTVGDVEVAEGLFLFEPADDDTALRRVFVPRAAHGAVELGRTALETAMQAWATTPAQLLACIEAQGEQPVPPLGLAAQSLGLLTAAQVERCLPETRDDRPLGQVLIDNGLITHAQLQALIAHKMGCAVVDLTRFVPERAALARLPQRVAFAQRVLPLCIVQDSLYIASDLAFTAERQRAIQAYTSMPLVPVLARTAHLSAALRDLDSGAGSAGAA